MHSPAMEQLEKTAPGVLGLVCAPATGRGTIEGFLDAQWHDQTVFSLPTRRAAEAKTRTTAAPSVT